MNREIYQQFWCSNTFFAMKDVGTTGKSLTKSSNIHGVREIVWFVDLP
jgi:hypothetical protein